MNTLPEHVRPVPLEKAYRLLNHGPTVLVSAADGARRNVMAAAWSMPVDFNPPKVAVVIDGATFTRELIEASGELVLSVPCRESAEMTMQVGTVGARDLTEDKFSRFGIATFAGSKVSAPLIRDCVAWLACQVLPHPGNEQAHDLFLATVVAAYADERVFTDGHWHFETAPEALRTLHYVAGGHFYAIGDPLVVRTDGLPG